MREMIQETLTPCAGYLAHPFVENDGFCERMCQVASTAILLPPEVCRSEYGHWYGSSRAFG